MKRILVFLLSIIALNTVTAVTNEVQAQQVAVFKMADDTLTNADTSYIKINVPDDAKSIHVVVKRASGTAAGRAVLKAYNDDGNPVGISTDTLSFSNNAVNSKIWTISPLYYGTYYIELISSGTTKLTAKAYVCRRRYPLIQQ